MVLKIYQPTTAGRRGTSVSNDKDVLKRDKKSKKERPLPAQRLQWPQK